MQAAVTHVEVGDTVHKTVQIITIRTLVILCNKAVSFNLFKLSKGASLRGWSDEHPSLFSVGFSHQSSCQPLLYCAFSGSVQLSVLVDTGP